jgi:protein-tyrosine phosphatase
MRHLSGAMLNMTSKILPEKARSKLMAIKREIRLLLQNVHDSVSYGLERSGRLPACTRKVVFVCMGNICRSPFAEYLMKAQPKGMQLSIESCGLDAGIGTPPPIEAIKTAKKFGVHMEGHLSRGWECCELSNSDLILAMEFWQYRKLIELLPNKKENIRLLREFAGFPENLLCNINDPFGQSEIVFDRCFRQIERSITNIFSKI